MAFISPCKPVISVVVEMGVDTDVPPPPQDNVTKKVTIKKIE